MHREFDPSEFLGYLLAHAMKGMAHHISSGFHASGYPIDRSHWIILMKTTLNKKPMPQSKLVAFMMGNKVRVTRAVDDLVQLEWLSRTTDPDDRRNRLLSVTSKGKEVLPELFKVVTETIQLATDGLEEEEIETCKKVLRTIIKNMNALNQPE